MRSVKALCERNIVKIDIERTGKRDRQSDKQSFHSPCERNCPIQIGENLEIL